MREIRSYGSTRGLQVKGACDPVRSSRVRRNVLDHGCFFHLRSTLLDSMRDTVVLGYSRVAGVFLPRELGYNSMHGI